MRLKKLKIVGFKSFADKVVIDFDSEIVGIVGPNGCGKSNIVDAFRWVLGEQSAKSMRASGMQDVLFAGTSKRAALNYAEVSITLTDVSETLKTPYDEITITRRLYRDGEAEYLLNREVVRLRDIHHLLLGSGIGRNAFSIFEQGRIDRVIHLAPQQRRSIFDEAAGIGLFLEKKKETLRKLSQATENFNRLHDVYGEVARQASTLKRQAALAKAYQENKEKLAFLEKSVLATKLRALLAQGSVREQEYLELQEQHRQLALEVEQQMEEARKSKEHLLIEERDGQAKRERLYQAEKSFEVQRVEIKRAQERLQQLQTQLHSLHEEKKGFTKLSVVEVDKELEARVADLEERYRQLSAEKEELGRLQLEAAKAHEARFLAQEIEKKREGVALLQKEAEEKRTVVETLKSEAETFKKQWQKADAQAKEQKQTIDQLHRHIAKLALKGPRNGELLKAFPKKLKPLADVCKNTPLLSYQDTLIVSPKDLDEVLAFAKKEGIENFSLFPSKDGKFKMPVMKELSEGLYVDELGVLFKTTAVDPVKLRKEKEQAEKDLARAQAALIDPTQDQEIWRKKEMLSVQENFFLQECRSKLVAEEKALGKLEQRLKSMGETTEVEVHEERLEELKALLPDLAQELHEQRRLWNASEQTRVAANAKKQAQEERSAKIAVEIEECEKHRILCEKMLNSREGNSEGLESEVATLRAQFEKQHEGLEKQREKLAALEEKLGKMRGRLHGLQEKLHKLEVASASQNVARQELEKALEGQEWQSVEDVAVAEAEKEMRLLRVTIEKSSQVNLLAIDEYAESEKRAAHLKTQTEDLEKAKKELEQIILKLDQESRKIFKTTFEQVRENFRKNFGILFRGGEADLRFTDSSDVLEAGIDIVAKPPGKKLRSISLLSGGEKCLTALALLFAIFEVRRAPFCILDEVDAPLDESNIGRFCEMLRQFTDKTQFIIVTHNKKTMSIADILIGVSMEEKGVSKLLSLAFANREELEPAL